MKFSRIAALAASLTVVAVLATACSGGAGTAGGTPDANATIRIGSLSAPLNLSNVDAGGQGVTEALNGNVYEGLFQLSDDGKVVNRLATDYSVSPDGLAYTVKLRSGVTFHSGKALTSADVKSSLERVLADSSQSARKSQLAVVDSVETPDPETVVFHLKSRSISFPYNLTYVWIVNTDAKDLKTAEDGTGPYTVDQFKRGSSLTLKRFSDYWGTAAKSKEVDFTYFTDASALSNALLTNAVDIVTQVQSPDALTQFTGNKDFTVSENTSTTKELLAFNDKVAPFDDKRVRKAITQAIDNKKLLDSIWDGRGTLIGSMVPPTDPWYEDLTAVNPYDPAAAKSLLAEAGQSSLSFTLDTPSYDPHPAVAEFIKSELAKVGVTVKINTISEDQWYTNVFQKKDFAATLQEHVNDRDLVWYGNPDFYWGYNNPQVVQWVADAEQASSTDEQTAILKKVNTQIAEDAASDWLFLAPQIVVASSSVKGYPLHGLNSQFFVADIEKTQ
ncbi:ABC transporter substrate-binding protein [Microbacterium azadirachtae]|uniref:Glutathione-binding protein GsiB n=1 Tax=Microbacterium azadirachtae TaxID=582680 RepID=A0A0F0LT51_9MICO|nr:ABC transporter substrate-binding protein [Microbacterium azadirachtae]KJL35894.1 Glutathione-binding protein GsiB precursor [Microbacterium azadirachtae]